MRDGKGSVDRLLGYIWKWEVNKINDHLPKKTIPLSELLAQKEPAIESRDGSRFCIDKDELANVANLVPNRMHAQLHFPILMIRRMDLGEGVFSISGGKLENFFAAKVLGMTDESFDNYELAETAAYIYRPQVRDLRRKLRTLSVIGFGGVGEENVEDFDHLG